MTSQTSTAAPAATDEGPSKVRHVRVPHQLWTQATEKAKRQDGIEISEAVRALLRAYVAGRIEL